MTTLDLRGRDLIIIPPKELLHLPTEALQEALFGKQLPAAIRISMGRDKRQHFLRTQPMNFSVVKSALRKQQTPFTVAFEERPALPFETALQMEPRPYQEEALTRWQAESSAGVVVLPTGAGKTLVAAMAIHETGLWTLAVVPTLDLLQQWRSALTSALGLSTDDASTEPPNDTSPARRGRFIAPTADYAVSKNNADYEIGLCAARASSIIHFIF